MRWLLGAGAVVACAAVPGGEGPGVQLPSEGLPGRRAEGERCEPERWPHLEAYVERFVAADGRVIDPSDQRSTSEGQAYGLFFALVAGDQALFDRLLAWTEDNLAGSELGARLPAWHWGQAEDGSWRILDENAASDADVWIAYALLEAEQLFAEPRYGGVGRRLAEKIAAEEVAVLPGLGAMLLPGPHGFVLEAKKRWRLNPSYLPLPVLRGLASRGAPGPWSEIAQSSAALLTANAATGLAPDWALYEAGRGFGVDPVSGPKGSFDAIRCYLWAGMIHSEDPERARVLGALFGLLELWRARGFVPESVDVRAPASEARRAPVGFHAALIPLAAALGDSHAADQLTSQVVLAKSGELFGSPATYYDQNLVLFARGFMEQRFSFDAAGRLIVRWTRSCAK